MPLIVSVKGTDWKLAPPSVERAMPVGWFTKPVDCATRMVEGCARETAIEFTDAVDGRAPSLCQEAPPSM